MRTAYTQLTTGCDYRPSLRMVKDDFPQIEITPPGGPPKWTTVTLNQHGQRIDAVRFTSPLDRPADMRWCFILAPNVLDQWYIIPFNSEMEGFHNYWKEFGVDTENLDEPRSNFTTYQPLDGGQILPAGEYILWFAFREAAPVELRLTIKLLPAAGNAPEFDGPEAIAKELGLRVPLRFHDPATVEECVMWTRYWALDDPQKAAAFAEKGLELAPEHRELLGAAAKMNRLNGSMAADRDTGVALYRKAADQVRLLLARHDDLPPAYRLLAVNALVDEACFVHRDNPPAAVASLRSAFDAGFCDIDQLEAAEELAFLHTLPEYQALIEEWRRRLAPPGEIDYELKTHPDDAVEFNGHWYKYYAGMLPWHLAHERCRGAGGYLAGITSKAEADFVRTTWLEGNFWLGGVRAGDDRWKWVNGESFDYRSWSPGESASSDDEPRLRVSPQGFWYSVPLWDADNLGYLCEWEQ